MTTDILAELNPKQREAVETIDGPLLIVAGPGSGKTRVITHRIGYLVRVCGVTPYRIVAVTFTNKAAREMRQRLVPLLGGNTRDLIAGTFHSFCAMLLRREGEALKIDRNFAIYDDTDQMDALKRSMKEVDVDPKRFGIRAIQSRISGAKSQLLGLEGFAQSRKDYFDEIVLRVYERYDELLTRSSALDFDDLLLKTHVLLDRFPEITNKYENRFVHFMIDEFQDTNIAQYAIAKQLSQKYRNLCVVGDPDQSIYSWRNADIRNILSFQSDFPEAKVIALEENYRSTQTILGAAEKLIAVNTQRVDKDLWTSNGQGVPIVVSEAYDQQEEAQFVLKEVQNLHGGDNGAYALGDIAVMYRVNVQSRALEEACLRYGVPYQVIGGLKFYQRHEVKDVTAYLRLVANPHDDVSLNRVINVPTRGIGQRTLDEVTRMARDGDVSMFSAIEELVKESEDNGREHGQSSGRLAARSLRALANFHELITYLATKRSELDLIELIDAVLERVGYKRYMLEEAERGEERWENIQEYRATARDYLFLGVGEALTAFPPTQSHSSHSTRPRD
jgi:DNA helicase-2/ATP-dependent DNA helicase PcrA